MKVIVNKPAMPPVPPTTYDLLGLTPDDISAIRLCLIQGSLNKLEANRVYLSDTLYAVSL